mgnify:FL=1|jgi:hypothetical protein|tara:strand:- start:6239 stop:6763 length:525 start_codon:yes stop_codon:yes gene_type:complete
MPSGIEGDTSDIVEFSERLKNCAITIDILKYLNGLAIDNDYNRQIVPSFLDETMDSDLDIVADNRFPCVLVMAMPHYHKQGVETDTHVRLMFEVIVKRIDGMPLDKEYTTVAVDVPMEAIEILPNIPDVRWVETSTNRKDWLNIWDKVDKQGMTDTFINEIENLLKREGENDNE